MKRKKLMNKQRMQTFQAWAIVHSGNEIDCWDFRVPIYWYRIIAKQELRKNTFSDRKVVRVVIREASPKKKLKLSQRSMQ